MIFKILKIITYEYNIEKQSDEEVGEIQQNVNSVYEKNCECKNEDNLKLFKIRIKLKRCGFLFVKIWVGISKIRIL